MAATADAPSEIFPEVLYPLPRFMAITGLKKTGLRAARRRGLRILYYGRRGYIRGADWIRHVEETATESRPDSR
ncbi:MAG: hypothetical protein KY475_26650 [Planctomycetes bacterium]|nr:hypothetical protein [Planctomycetota bacterium]